MSSWLPREIEVKASALDPTIHEAMTEGRRFSFKWSDGAATSLFTGKAEQADMPGVIRITDIRLDIPA